MSLYEALDRFVGAGVLACAGLVGSEMPAGGVLDGAALSRFLRERRQGEEFGAVLDCLAKEIWLAQDQRGFPQRLCESHASALANLIGEIRLEASDLAPALEAARQALAGGSGAGSNTRLQIADAWIERARLGGRLEQAGLIEDVAQFLMELLFLYVIEQPRFLAGLKADLAEFKTMASAIGGSGTAAVQLPVIGVAYRAGQTRSDCADGTSAAPVQSVAGLVSQDDAAAAAKGQAVSPSVPPSVSGPIAEIVARHGIPEGALRRFQSILVAQSMPAEQRMARLEELGGWLAATLAHLTAPSNDSIELRRLKSDAATALGSGDFERAMELLKEVRQTLRDGRRRTEALLAEEMEALKFQMMEEAATTARLAELALARFDFEVAAEQFADAAASLPAGQTALEADYRQRQAEALAAQADINGDTKTLQAAAAAFRGAMELISRTADPAAWARLGVGLGDMLMALGQRTPGATLELEQAAVTYETVVSVIDRTTHPMRWALVQLSRSAALMELGQRVDRERHWKSAAASLMPALEVFESRGAEDLAAAARAKLRVLHGGLDGNASAQPALQKPAQAG